MAAGDGVSCSVFISYTELREPKDYKNSARELQAEFYLTTCCTSIHYILDIHDQIPRHSFASSLVFIDRFHNPKLQLYCSKGR